MKDFEVQHYFTAKSYRLTLISWAVWLARTNLPLLAMAMIALLYTVLLIGTFSFLAESYQMATIEREHQYRDRTTFQSASYV